MSTKPGFSSGDDDRDVNGDDDELEEMMPLPEDLPGHDEFADDNFEDFDDEFDDDFEEELEDEYGFETGDELAEESLEEDEIGEASFSGELDDFEEDEEDVGPFAVSQGKGKDKEKADEEEDEEFEDFEDEE